MDEDVDKGRAGSTRCGVLGDNLGAKKDGFGRKHFVCNTRRQRRIVDSDVSRHIALQTFHSQNSASRLPRRLTAFGPSHAPHRERRGSRLLRESGPVSTRPRRRHDDTGKGRVMVASSRGDPSGASGSFGARRADADGRHPGPSGHRMLLRGSPVSGGSRVWGDLRLPLRRRPWSSRGLWSHGSVRTRMLRLARAGQASTGSHPVGAVRATRGVRGFFPGIRPKGFDLRCHRPPPVGDGDFLGGRLRPALLVVHSLAARGRGRPRATCFRARGSARNDRLRVVLSAL